MSVAEMARQFGTSHTLRHQRW